VLIGWLENILMIESRYHVLLFQVDIDLLQKRITQNTYRNVLVISEQRYEVFEQRLPQLEIKIAVDQNESEGLVEDRSKHVSIRSEPTKQIEGKSD
jgi:hypothetical protein